MLLSSLRHGYSNLANFRGRDSRALFWPFAGVHIAAVLVIWMPFFLSEFIGITDRMRAFAEANPDKATVSSGPGHYSITIHEPVPGLTPDFELMMMPLAVLAPIFVLLMAAAVTRRLHDAGWAGWIGMVPAVLFGIGLYGMMQVIGQVGSGAEPSIAGFFGIVLVNLGYNVSLLVLIILLCLSTKPEANQYGEPPA